MKTEDILPDAFQVPPRRSVGRPRKDWSAFGRPLTPVATGESYSIQGLDACSLNVADAELMIQFLQHTAETLHEPGSGEMTMDAFWKRNVPKIGLAYPLVLHLACALAGFHLAHLTTNSDDRERRLSMAMQHSDAGLKQLNEALPSINDTNCGALYVSALLVSYCAFAAGPTGERDLLIGTVGSEATEHQTPLIHGVRYIRQAIEPATLFSGLTAPLQEPRPNGSRRVTRPRIDWVRPVAKLQEWITSSASAFIYEHTLVALSAVYEANYGHDGDGEAASSSSNQFVFGWLYRLQDTFIARLRQKEPQALLILAYYVPLLGTVEPCWFLTGWAEHLLKSIRDMLSTDMLDWLEWPERIIDVAPVIKLEI